MRVGIVRSDIGSIYTSDVENSSQRNFSSEPSGQSRYLKKPTDDELKSVLTTSGVAAVVLGTNTTANVDTSTNSTLRIRSSASSAYTVIAVTAGAVTAKGTIAGNLNAAFKINNLPFVASVDTTNALRIKSTISGPSSYLQIDTVANGSTLSTAVGFNAAGVISAGVSVASLKTVVYPTPVTIDVSAASISALGSISTLTADERAVIVDAIADVVAPRFVETGLVLVSFDRGFLSELRSATFQPGSTRSGLPAGIAAAIVDDDGVTPFTI